MKKSLRVVVIDDNPADAALIRRSLERITEIDVDLTHYADADAGRRAVIETRPDCILLDYLLGKTSGIEVLTKIREAGVDAPVVAVTGHGSETVAVEALQRGAQDYLVKSVINPQSLRRAILNAIDKVRLERSLKQKQAELESFVSVVAHDLKQPLVAMMSKIELIRDFYDGCLDNQGRDFVRSALRTSEQMSELIEALLTYSRVGRSEVPFEPTDLGALVDSILEVLAEAVQNSEATVIVGSLPVLCGDRVALTQLLQNLTANALKFRGKAAPIIELGADNHPDGWTVWVKDNGIGIPAEHQEEIFTPFQRLHSRESYEGSGIGLATCKRIMEQHGGRICVESRPPHGTTFMLRFPAASSSKSHELRPQAYAL